MQPDETDMTPTEPKEPTELPVAWSPTLTGSPFWSYLDLALVIGLLVAFVALILFIAGAFVFAYPKLREDQAPLLLPTQVALYIGVYLSLRIVLGLRYGKPVFRSLGWCGAQFNLVVTAVS